MDHDIEIELPAELSYLQIGDIVRVHPQSGRVHVVYRRRSNHNTLFFTERCNSSCIMCSQPPRVVNDDYLVGSLLEAIPLMSQDTEVLGITGGEPTLSGDRFLQVLDACKGSLPTTRIHCLSNGRSFQFLKFCRRVQAIAHQSLTFGIPIYSDLPDHHNWIVQAAEAFDQTVRGIMNLKRCEQRIEIRIVLIRQVVDRLLPLAEFIARNLPFADHIALMGMEPIGHARMHLESIWADPIDFEDSLVRAIEVLNQAGIPVSIYNLPLCLVPPQLREYARQSISDWKNEFLPICGGCALKSSCCGFFHSSNVRLSRGIRPIHLT